MEKEVGLLESKPSNGSSEVFLELISIRGKAA